MVGRLAMNSTWEVAKFDEAIFGEDLSERPTREQVLLQYADFVQNEQDIVVAKGQRLSNTILIRPIINFFQGEYKGADFRKRIGIQATRPEYQGKVKQLIIDELESYR